MAVITLRGPLGSGAPEIGRIIADRLHADYVDREIIAQVAARLQREEQDVMAKEMPMSGVLGRIVEALERSLPVGVGAEGAYLPAWEIPLNDTRYLQALDSVVRELAQNPSLVMIGRGSQFILKDHPGAFHVFTVASAELRFNRVREQLKLGPEAVKQEMNRFDNGSREFIRRYFHAGWEDPVQYDLVINTGRFSFDAAASVIIDALPQKDRNPGPGR